MQSLDKNAIVIALFLIAAMSLWLIDSPKDILLAICSGLIGALKNA